MKPLNEERSCKRKILSTFISGVLAASMVPALSFATEVSADSPSGETSQSFRYENGNLIEDPDLLEYRMQTDDYYIGGEAAGRIMESYAIVEDSSGAKMFNDFDRFDRGYYTGTDAKKGVDVSSWQYDIDWAKVKASGVDFAIIRCGYGMDEKSQDDKYWLKNVRGCQQNNIPFGVYLYSYADSIERASSEADHVLRCLKEAGLSPHDLAYPVYYDLEDNTALQNGADFAAIATTFCDKIQQSGYQVGTYASLYWYTHHLTDPVFDNWYRWVAEYNATIGLTYEKFANFPSSNGIWQFSSLGQIDGISTNADLNYSYFYGVAGGERTLPDGIYGVNLAYDPNMSLDIMSAGTHDGANLQIWGSNGSDAQKFRLTYIDGYYKVENVASGKPLDVENAALVAGANVAQWQSNDTDAQRWRIDRNDDGTYTLISKVSGHALDVVNGLSDYGTNVRQWFVNGAIAQRFIFTPFEVNGAQPAVANGLYTISAAQDQSKVLDIANGSRSDGANLQLWDANGSGAQMFYLSYKDGFYTINSAVSGLMVDVASASFHSGANVWQWAGNGTDAQKWRIDRNNDGTYTFICKASGKALDIPSGNAYAGANIHQWESNGSIAQRFVISKVG